MNKIFLFLLFCLIFPIYSLAYNDEATHPGITEQTIEFYNLNNDIKIGLEDKELIIQGSIDEDLDGRPLNHFYEPQRQMGINDYRNAVEWVTESNNGNEFTWDKNIAKYAEGDREGALIGLGHILHIVADMTVPDHTRNDPHMGEDGVRSLTGTGNSPYEDWAKENMTRNTMRGTAQRYKGFGYKIRNTGDTIKQFLETISAYSNGNYVSADTISNGIYPYPEVIEKRDGYAYGKDSFFYDKHKLYIDFKSRDGENIKSLVYENIDGLDLSVLEEYFDRLVKMAILDGAGVVNLFIQEAENARAIYLAEEKKRLEDEAFKEAQRAQKIDEASFLSKIWYKTGYAVTDTIKLWTESISSTINLAGTAIYNGTSLAFNFGGNVLNLTSYTSNQLATVVAEKAEQEIQKAQKVIVSTGQKVILYVKETAPKVITPAVAYNPPTLTEEQVVKLIDILSEVKADNLVGEEDQIENEPVAHRNGGGGGNHNSDEPEASVISTTTSTTTLPATTTTPFATSTPGFSTTTIPVTSPIVLSVTNITNTTPTTTILFNGSSTVDFIISNNFNSATSSADEFGDWSLSIENIPTGTTTIEFFAEPDIFHSSTSTFDAITNTTNVIQYIKSEATEALIFIEDNGAPDIFASDPEECVDSLLADRCLITTTDVNMSWNSSSSKLDYFVIIINDDIDNIIETTSTSSLLSLEDRMDNTVEIFAVDTEGVESDHIIYEIIVYKYPVVINEVAWMGTNVQWQNEWIELYNQTNYDIDLADWVLKTEDGGVEIILDREMPANNFWLFERTDDTTVPDITADYIYTGDLNNDGEKLILLSGTTVMDETSAGAWPAGNNETKKTMERVSAWWSGGDTGNWQDYQGRLCSIEEGLAGCINGTPGAPNSEPSPM